MKNAVEIEAIESIWRMYGLEERVCGRKPYCCENEDSLEKLVKRGDDDAPIGCRAGCCGYDAAA